MESLMEKFNIFSILAVFINKVYRGAEAPRLQHHVLDDAEGNGFLLRRNHFCHVVLAGVRILSWQWAFILGSNTICFSFGGNKFPLNPEVFKGSNHRNHPLSGFRKPFSIYSSTNRNPITELC
jgi:hypothetical protein